MLLPPSYAALANVALEAIEALASRARDAGNLALWNAATVLAAALVELHTRALVADRVPEFGTPDGHAGQEGALPQSPPDTEETTP